MTNKRGYILFAFILLLIAANPMLSSNVSPKQNDMNTSKDFVFSADGDTSSSSITSFSETLTDDVLFYPDAFLNDTPNLAVAGTYTGSASAGSYSNTHALDASVYTATDTGAPYVSAIYLNITLPSEATEGIAVNIYGKSYAQDGTITSHDLLIYDGSSWVDYGDLTEHPSYGWTNSTTIYDPDYIIDSKVMIAAYVADGSQCAVYVDYAEAVFYYMTLADSDHYAESFADVSDWTTVLGNPVTSNGDEMSVHLPDDNTNDIFKTNSPSISNVFGYYIEIRWRNNVSGYGALFTVYGYPLDDQTGGGSLLTVGNQETSTVSKTVKYYIDDDIALECIAIYAKCYGTGDKSILFDYLRISPATETGWQHDGSTTTATEWLTNAEFDTLSSSSDGDILNFTSVRGSGTDTNPNAYVKIYYDMTDTKADLESTYYQFFEMNYSAPSGVPYLYAYWDPKIVLYELIEDSNWHIVRVNVAAGSSSSLSYIRLQTDYTYTNGAVGNMLVDWVKAYSIANFTYTGSGVSTDDYLYMSSDTLYCSGTSFTSIVLDHDPALSVATAAYNVWNLTTSSGTPQIDFYVAAWAGYSSETRGALASGTLTDIRLKFTASANAAAITFISDGTAPQIVRSFATPDPADDDETVTLSAVIEDSIEVYTVNFNAITYPSGFSDVDYSASEQSDNLWTYSFSSLTAGYYCFKIIGSDGANINALTEYGYISLTVRLGIISISPITFFGVGNDFSQMQLSFDINRNCNYTIYESSATYPEADTGTGTVYEGWNNIAWDKIVVADELVDFGIRFINGSLSTWANGSYAIAQTTFYLEWVQESETFETVTVKGYLTKTGAYAIYDSNNTLKTTGTIDDNTFRITFDKWNLRDLEEHNYLIRFSNGSQVCWYNDTFYCDNPDQYKGGGVVSGFSPDVTFWLGVLIATTFGSAVIAVLTKFFGGGGNFPNYK